MLAASLVNCRFECARALFGYGLRDDGGKYSTDRAPALGAILGMAVHAPRLDEWSRGQSNEANDKTVQMPKGSAFGQVSSFTPEGRAADVRDGANCAGPSIYTDLLAN